MCILKSLKSLKRNATDNYLHDYNRETSVLAQQSRELCDCAHQMLGDSCRSQDDNAGAK